MAVPVQAQSMANHYFNKRPILGPHSGSPLVSACTGLASRYARVCDDEGEEKIAREAAMLYKVAEGHYGDGQPKECLEIAAQALKKFQELGDQVGAADTVIIIVNAHMLEAFVAMEKPDEAIRIATDHKSTFAQMGDRSGEACMTLLLAELLVRSSKGAKDIARALDGAEEACKVFRDMENKKMEASSQLVLCGIYFRKNRAEDAHQAADTAESIFTVLEDKSGEAKARHARGMAFLIPDNYAQAVRSAQGALTLYQELGDKRSQAFELSVIAQWQLSQGKPHHSLRSAREAYAIARTLSGIKYHEVCALLLICESLLERDQAKEAVKMAQEGLTALEDSGDKCGIIAGLEILIHSQMSGVNPKDALETARRSLIQVQDFGDKRLELNLLYTICEARHASGLDSSAVDAMRDAALLARELHDEEEEANALRMESYINSCTPDLDNQATIIEAGIEAASSARTIFKGLGHACGEASSLMLLLYLKSKSWENEEYQLNGGIMSDAKEARALYQGAEDVSGENVALAMIIDLHSKNEEFEQALDIACSSVKLWKDLKKKRAQAEAMYRVAHIYTLLQYSSDAVSEILEARELCREVGALGLEAKLLLLQTQADVAEMAKMELPNKNGEDPLPEAFLEIRARAYSAVKDALLLAGKSGDRAIRAAALFWRSQVLVWGFTLKAAEALRSAVEAERLFAQIKDFRGQSHAMVLCADLHFMLGQKKEAKDRANKAQNLAMERSECWDAEEGAQTVLSRLGEGPPTALEQGGEAGGALAIGGPPATGTVATKPGLVRADVMPKLMDLIRNAISDDDGTLEQDTPLMDAGIDSLSSVQLTGDVGRAFMLPLAPSVIFDYPTTRQLIDHLIEESQTA